LREWRRGGAMGTIGESGQMAEMGWPSSQVWWGRRGRCGWAGGGSIRTGRVYGYSVMDRLVMTGLTTPQAAAMLAVTITAFQVGLFEVEVVDAVIIVIFVTCIAGPLVTRWAGRRVVEETEAEQSNAEAGESDEG
jgi:hypothetical protein